MTTRRLVLSLAVGSALALTLASVALATHARPGSGTPFRVPLVPAYNACTAGTPPNSTHVIPIALPSCSPPVLNSDILTMGTTGLGGGFLKLSVFCIATSTDPTPPCTSGDSQEEEDVKVDSFASDVRCLKATSGCTAAGADYTGQLIGRSLIRITDHANGSPVGTKCTVGSGASPCVTATVEDTTFAVPTAAGTCVPVTGTPGSTCSYSTTINAAVPGAVNEFQRGVVSVFGIEIMDAGEDGLVGPGCAPVCGTGDETKFLDQGIFLP